MSNLDNSGKTIFSFWTQNLVESPSVFAFNFLISFVAGVLYSFKVFPSGYILFLFGVVSPIIFTICLYDLLLSSNGEIMGEPIPKAFNNGNRTKAVMLFDCLLILLFAALIHFNVLNFFVFRFLQTVFFPLLLLSILKGFYYFKYQNQ